MSCLDLKMEDFRTNIAFFFAKSGTTKMEDFRTNFAFFFAKSGTTNILGISLDDAFTRNLLFKCYNITFTLFDHIPFNVFLWNLSI